MTGSRIAGPGRRVALGAGLALPWLASRALAQPAPLTVVGGQEGGVYFPLAQAIAQTLAAGGRPAQAERTGGAVVNAQLLGTGRAQLALTQVDVAAEALRGEERFRGRPVPLAVLAALFEEHLHLLAARRSPVQRLEDLRGQRVSIGAPGSATDVVAGRILPILGLERERDLAARQRLGPSDSAALLRDGRLDAMFFMSAAPAPVIAELLGEGQGAARLVATDSVAASLNLRHGAAYGTGALDGGIYPFLAAPVPTLTVTTVLVARADLPEAVATAILEQLLPALPRFDLPLRIRMAELVGRQAERVHDLPWHPAAPAFWRAAGAPIP